MWMYHKATQTFEKCVEGTSPQNKLLKFGARLTNRCLFGSKMSPWRHVGGTLRGKLGPNRGGRGFGTTTKPPGPPFWGAFENIKKSAPQNNSKCFKKPKENRSGRLFSDQAKMGLQNQCKNSGFVLVNIQILGTNILSPSLATG